MIFNSDETTIKEIEAFMQQYLSDRHPDLDITQGSNLYDLLVRPFAPLVAYFRYSSDQIRSFLSISDLIGTEETDSKEVAVDSLLSNFFVTRSLGSPAFGVVEVKVPYANQSVGSPIAVVDSFWKAVDSSGNTYTVDSTVLKTYTVPFANSAGNEVTINYTDVTQTAIDSFSFDIIMTSDENGTDKSLSSGTVLLPERGFGNRMSLKVKSSFKGSSDPETSDEMIMRASDAISTRNLSTPRGIRYSLLEKVPMIENIYVAGYGSPEMKRDAVVIPPSTTQVNIGGKVDVYGDLPYEDIEITSSDFSLRTGADGRVYRDFIFDGQPIAAVLKVEWADQSGQWESSVPGMGHVPLQEELLEDSLYSTQVEGGYFRPGSRLTISFLDSSGVEHVKLLAAVSADALLVDDFLEGSADSAAGSDVRFVMRFPVIVGAKIDIKRYSGSTLSESEVADRMAQSMSGSGPLNMVSVMSDLMSFFSDDIEHIDNTTIEGWMTLDTGSGGIFYKGKVVLDDTLEGLQVPMVSNGSITFSSISAFSYVTSSEGLSLGPVSGFNVPNFIYLPMDGLGIGPDTIRFFSYGGNMEVNFI